MIMITIIINLSSNKLKTLYISTPGTPVHS